jgi:hypothetical protein
VKIRSRGTAFGPHPWPRIRRYAMRLCAGEVPPDITIDGALIVDGHHRYLAGIVYGRPPPSRPGVAGTTKPHVEWEEAETRRTRGGVLRRNDIVAPGVRAPKRQGPRLCATTSGYKLVAPDCACVETRRPSRRSKPKIDSGTPCFCLKWKTTMAFPRHGDVWLARVELSELRRELGLSQRQPDERTRYTRPACHVCAEGNTT